MSNSKLSTRYNLFPIKDIDAFNFYTKLDATFWSHGEMSYNKDVPDYQRLKIADSDGKNAKKKRLIDMMLGFFAFGDGVISKNLVKNFLLKADTYEEQLFYCGQLHIEAVHIVTYSLTIQTLIPDEKEQKEIFEMVDNLPCVKAKALLMEEFIDGDYPVEDLFVAFAASEGIFFCVLFAIIFWFRSFGEFQHLIFMNEQIQKD